MQRRFGDFYRMGMPGLGAGLHGHLHILQDPKEMVKLLRRESGKRGFAGICATGCFFQHSKLFNTGVYAHNSCPNNIHYSTNFYFFLAEFPSGSTEFVWPPKVQAERYPNPAIALIGKGPEWKRLRTFAQTDLMAPKSAARYLPAAMEAARHSSKGVAHATRDQNISMNDFLNLASFDMFCNIMLGHLPGITDPDIPTNPQDETFCQAVAIGLRTNNDLMYSTYHNVMVTKLGIDTSLFKKFLSHWTTANEITKNYVLALKDLRDNRPEEMTLKQKNSYANQAFERQLVDDSITLEECESLVAGLLSAGVDTTGNMLTWRILHMAMHPEVQEKLYQELIELVDKKTGHLTEDAISTAKTPYLHACLRESHRCGNAVPVVPIKTFDTPIEVHGVTLPAGSVIALDGYTTGMNPDLVEDPTEYRPERFLKSAVEARKGTPAEIIDHAFFSGPFSQGARRCPGSRVANLEAHVFIAQLVLDWKMSIPSLKHWKDCPYGQDTLTVARLPKVEFTPRN